MTALEQIQKSGDFIELLPSESVSIDLRYASPNNFTGVNLYGDFNRAFLHRVAYEKFQRAIQNLRGAHPGYRFLVFDTRDMMFYYFMYLIGRNSNFHLKGLLSLKIRKLDGKSRLIPTIFVIVIKRRFPDSGKTFVTDALSTGLNVSR